MILLADSLMLEDCHMSLTVRNYKKAANHHIKDAETSQFFLKNGQNDESIMRIVGDYIFFGLSDLLID